MNTLNKYKKQILIGLVSVIAALLVFQVGIMVGYHKAFFSYSGGDRFYRMMEGGRSSMMGDRGNQFFFSDNLSPSHGVGGKVVSVTLPSFIVAAQNNLEKTVVVNDQTIVREFRDTVKATDIRAGDYTVVLGEPDASGNIQAKFIRIMPMMSSSSAPVSSIR